MKTYYGITSSELHTIPATELAARITDCTDTLARARAAFVAARTYDDDTHAAAADCARVTADELNRYTAEWSRRKAAAHAA